MPAEADLQTHNQNKHRRLCRNAFRRLGQGEHALVNWIQQCGPCALEVQWDRCLFEALVRAIAHQQLHGKAAETILGRLKSGYPGSGFPSAKQLSRSSVEKLRGCGFSAAKVAAIHGIAHAQLRGQIPDRQSAANMSDTELIDQLTELRGVGRWTVEMLLIFTLGRIDVMPVDDFGVRHGLKLLLNLHEMPTPRHVAEYASVWAPYRTVAAWYLWRRADAAKRGKSD